MRQFIIRGKAHTTFNFRDCFIRARNKHDACARFLRQGLKLGMIPEIEYINGRPSVRLIPYS